MKKTILIILGVMVAGALAWYGYTALLWFKAGDDGRAVVRAQEEAIERVLSARRAKMEKDVNTTSDPFGEDGTVRILLLGLDKRVGQTNGHCDVIQMVSIDKVKEHVTITAVPRGTYSPLPPGAGTTSSDYYVSNACAFGGIEYGITQIEKIVGYTADYVVIVGFSETLGILRSLRLPTTETLQWLRQRHVYQIGEPQRAHNHSTFIKKMLIDYIPDEPSKIDTVLHYIIYKIVQTDLTFDEAETIVRELSRIQLAHHPDNISLTMRPAHTVADIPYIPSELNEYLEKTMDPIKNRLSRDDYSGNDTEAIQEQLRTMIIEKKDDPAFIAWAFENNLWLQIENETERLSFQYECIERYLATRPEIDFSQRKTLISDYILEMEHGGFTEWVERGKKLLAQEIGQ